MLYNIKELIFKNQLTSQNSEIITLTDIIALLNQAHADHRLAYIWFFKIALSVHLCEGVCLPPSLLIVNCVIWNPR